MKKRWWNSVKRYKKTALAILITLIILLAFFSTQIALFFNFVLGNDIAVKLKVSPEYLQLVHGQEESLTVEATVTTNPFCKAICSSLFEDISNKTILDNTTFTIRPSDPFQQEYQISAPRIGEGLKVYRFSMECQSVQTVLCHTSKEPSTRSVLITAEYTLTPEEKELRSVLWQQLQDIAQRFKLWEDRRNSYNLALQQMHVSPITGVDLSTQLPELEQLWQQQDFTLLVQHTDDLDTLLMRAEEQIEDKNVTLLVERYNSMIEDLRQARALVESLSTYDAMSEATRTVINETALEFNTLMLVFESVSFEQKENITNTFVASLNSVAESAYDEQRAGVLRTALESDVHYGLLCDLTGTCYNHPLLTNRANQTTFNLNQTCDNNLLHDRIRDLNSSLADEYAAQGYLVDDAFISNVSAYLFNLKQQQISQYRQNIPPNATNTLLLQKLLAEKPLRIVAEYSYNLTPALVTALASVPSCTAVPISIPELASINLTPVIVPPITASSVALELVDPLPQCCIFGECHTCCISEACRNDPSTYPVVFIHGHAVSKDTSFEYSLEGFNTIQKKMEEEGYLSAGSITLYTSRDVPEGIWGTLPVPVSIRASYYFDLFQQPENYVVVQTKSENIDTYAVRLKEVIDTIKYKTGKPKVNVVAFSMGSLVSRRYLQIFGSENVHTLILIGAPNKGIVGSVADYCSVTGEQRECNDMQADSLFMNKLNRGSLPLIPIYNIIGTGCDMDGKQGDGTVLEENAYLEGAQNFIINGTCESISTPLHLTLRDIDKYPDVYEIVKEALEK